MGIKSENTEDELVPIAQLAEELDRAGGHVADLEQASIPGESITRGKCVIDLSGAASMCGDLARMLTLTLGVFAFKNLLITA